MIMMEEVWFQYLVDHKQYWHTGFTKTRLKKVKKFVFENKHVMWDLLDRHNGGTTSPQQMRDLDPAIFEHAMGNFASNIMHIMIDKQIYKP